MTNTSDKQTVYDNTLAKMKNSKTANDYIETAKLFFELGDFADAEQKAAECQERAVRYIYDKACSTMQEAKTDAEFQSVKKYFVNLRDYEDSEQKAIECDEKANEYLYEKAVNDMYYAGTSDQFLSTGKRFEQLGDYKDSALKAKECVKKAEDIRMEAIYKNGCDYQALDNVDELEKAIEYYKSIIGYKDTNDRIKSCENRIKEIKTRVVRAVKEKHITELMAAEKKKEKNKKIKKIVKAVLITLLILALGAAAYYAAVNYLIPFLQNYYEKT